RSRPHNIVLQRRSAAAGEPRHRRGARVPALSRRVPASARWQGTDEMSGQGKAGKAPAVPRPAATAIILRDGPAGLEVFMVVRHHEIDFASGALVFPGGKVDGQDADPAWAELAPSVALDADRAFLVAAARETFEEAGLLLARRRGGSELVDATTAHALVQRYRAPMLAGDATFLDLVRAEDLLLTPDLMV